MEITKEMYRKVEEHFNNINPKELHDDLVNNYGLMDELKCPSCGSKNIHIYSGMFTDRYECRDCGHEFR